MFWDVLLQLIEEGKVIPVVGRDLLTVCDVDGPKPLYPYLAEKLAVSLEVSPENLPAGEELNEVACRYISAGNRVEDIYPALKGVACRAQTQFDIPEVLRKLIEIASLRFFVTTTFDCFLSRALNQYRFGGNPETRVFAHSPSELQDLPRSMKASHDLTDDDPPVVYHLMGKLSAMPSYAVTQEDIVEYFHSLASETRRPQRLFDELNHQSLLIMGCRFEGWLTRFLMRMSKGQRLSSGGKSDFVADLGVSNDNNLVLFLRNFSRATKIYQSGGAIDFVDELHWRWLESHLASVPAPVRRLTEPYGQGLAATGAVFLSYASEDRIAAKRIKDALENAGVDVFFDRDDLECGNDWEAKLRRSISQCSLFVPVISRATSCPGHRFFRKEWNLAVDEAQAHSFSDDACFLLPVVIDDIMVSEADVPGKFRSIQWQSLPSGEPTPEFVSRVQKLYRKYQKSRFLVA